MLSLQSSFKMEYAGQNLNDLIPDANQLKL